MQEQHSKLAGDEVPRWALCSLTGCLLGSHNKWAGSNPSCANWVLRCTDFHFPGKNDVSLSSRFCFETKIKKKKKESSACPKRSLPISSGAWILLCLSSHQKDKALSCRNTLGRGKTQRTGDWQEARAAAPAQMPTAKQVLRSSFRSGLFLLFFRLFSCWGWKRNKEKSVKWRVRVYWSRKISHSCHFPVCYERQNHSRPWIMAARAAWNYCFLKLNCCWHAWNKQRY